MSALLTLELLTPAIGAVVRGVNLSEPTTVDVLRQLRQALDAHLVLFFEEQPLSPIQQRSFASRLGSLYVHPFYTGHNDAKEVMVLEHDAANRANSDRWHNDVTYLEQPPDAALLYAEIIPEVGGDTLWGNMYKAFDSLSNPLRELVSGLRAVHSFAKNFTPERFQALNMGDRQEQLYNDHPPVSHPVARINPTTGRRALFVNRDFTTHIEGLATRESDALLRFLFDHMAQPEFQVRWRWKPRTAALWDNRWAQHCALADYFPNRRLVRRVTILKLK